MNWYDILLGGQLHRVVSQNPNTKLVFLILPHQKNSPNIVAGQNFMVAAAYKQQQHNT